MPSCGECDAEEAPMCAIELVAQLDEQMAYLKDERLNRRRISLIMRGSELRTRSVARSGAR